MSLWGDVEPEVVTILGDAAVGLAEWAWHKITDDKSTESAKAAIKAIADKAKDAALAAALEHIRQLAGALDIPDALAKLADGAQGVKDAWAAAEKEGRERMKNANEFWNKPLPDEVPIVEPTDEEPKP